VPRAKVIAERRSECGESYSHVPAPAVRSRRVLGVAILAEVGDVGGAGLIHSSNPRLPALTAQRL
jgi:hypothetical protein